jgi:catechol 2,3-dioxygenase
MTAQSDLRPVANIKFSHFGLTVKDIGKMESFYSGVLGFTVTDRGEVAGLQLVFLSRDPGDHHQLILATGRPDSLPANTINPQFGPSINQISFKTASLADLRDMKVRLETGGATDLFPANHGIAWSIYAHDPEGNNLEFFLDTEWYFPQPFLIPLDFAKTDQEIYRETKALCESMDGFKPYSDWRKTVALRMVPFVDRAPAV